MKSRNFKYVLSTAILAAGFANAAPEISFKLIQENAAFTNDGALIGATSTNAYSDSATTKHSSGDTFKSETSLKVYMDGEINPDNTYHVELNLMKDTDAASGFNDNEAYTQRDPLREAYVDTNYNDWAVRAGKQQVVWGTADGIKLLDNINPTDYGEMAQNQMEDSRIPVWMLNAEKYTDDGGSYQLILSEARGHNIAGLGNTSAKSSNQHTNNNTSHPFIMKGVDTLVGPVNGFLNIAPAMGKVASAFSTNATAAGLSASYNYWVEGFTNNNGGGFAYLCTGATADADCLAKIANESTTPVDAGPNGLGLFASNVGGNDQKEHLLIDTDGSDSNWNTSNPNSMFEYMPMTTFSTFDRFVNMTSEYRVEDPEGANLGFRYKNSTKNGLNYSFNFLNHDDPNPYVEISWEKPDGTKLYEVPGTGNYATSVSLSTSNSATNTQSAGAYMAGGTAVAPNMVMTQKHNRINSLGGSFDYAVDTDQLGPVVLRGEFVYDKDTMKPVITRRAPNSVDLDHGFFASSFTPTKSDIFSYVLGADITALTNMMVSLQFIQINNLDHVDEGSSASSATWRSNTWRYTADAASMSLKNNLQKADKYKEFVSLYLSKPFGASGQHRWNNIFMYEDDGGKWNRLDVEYAYDDNTVLTAEYNKYFGNENTQFGQFKNSSNMQVGVKYSF